MTSHLTDILSTKIRKLPSDWQPFINLVETNCGLVRVLDTGGQKPIMVSVPDGANVIEYQESLIKKLSRNFRVVCIEMPGVGFSYPAMNYDFSLKKSALIVFNVLDKLFIDRAALSFSCSNCFYALKMAKLSLGRLIHLFLVQTPSISMMPAWVQLNVPKILAYPVIDQFVNSLFVEKLATLWYKTSLPDETEKTNYQSEAIHSIKKGGCFCLSSLVQGLKKDVDRSFLKIEEPITQIGDRKDYSHRNTKNRSIREYAPDCEIIEFADCGHFPDLGNTDKYVALVNERLVV